MGNNEFDGELISVEQATPTLNLTRNEQKTTDDDFFPMEGEVIPMVAANAAQNTQNYFDQDNFYPANGIFHGTILDKKERTKRRSQRQKLKSEKQAAKNAEAYSRAELNKTVGKDKPSDVALAEALKNSSDGDKIATETKKPMTINTKIAIGVGVVLVLGVAGYFIYKKYSK